MSAYGDLLRIEALSMEPSIRHLHPHSSVLKAVPREFYPLGEYYEFFNDYAAAGAS